jgi:predicted transcriptional regulator
MKKTWIEIWHDILEYCEGTPRKKTWIIYTVRINYNLGTDHLKQLIDRGLLIEAEDGYKTTSRGHNYIRIFSELIDFIKSPTDVVEGA